MHIKGIQQHTTCYFAGYWGWCDFHEWDLPERLTVDGSQKVDHHCWVLAFCDSELPHACLQDACVVFFPVSQPEWGIGSHVQHVPFVVFELGRLANLDYQERNRKGITAVIKQLSERGTRFGSSSLLAVDGVQGGIGEDAEGTIVENPGRDVVFEGEVVAQNYHSWG